MQNLKISAGLVSVEGRGKELCRSGSYSLGISANPRRNYTGRGAGKEE